MIYVITFLFHIFYSLLTHFGDTPEGRLRLFQTADVVFLYVNTPFPQQNGKIYGVCKREVHTPDEYQWSYNAVLMVGDFSKKIIVYSSYP